MKTVLVGTAALLASAYLPLGGPPGSDRSPLVGQQVFSFVLPSADGGQIGLSDYSDKQAIVLFFVGADCEVSKAYLPDLMELQSRLGDRVQVLGIQSDGADLAGDLELSFPVLLDEGQRIAEHLGASMTGQAFLLDQRHTVRYHGRIDSRFASGGEPGRRDLEEALAELLAGEPITVVRTEAAGRALPPIDRAAKFADVTYSKEVSRIIQNRCQVCHRPGMIGPFSLLTYDDAADWSDMIKEVVVQRRMPPWHADSRYGEFANDRRLTDDELDTLVAWVDAGTPEGAAADLPEPIPFVEGWQIGEPDLVLELPEEVEVPAGEVLPYMYFDVPTNFEEDVWVSAAEVQPGNFRVVHHVIVTSRLPGQRQGRGLSSFVPGGIAQASKPGTARKIPAGAVLNFQMHYTPIGRDQTDRTKIGLILYKGDEPPKSNASGDSLGNLRFRIPAGDPNYEVRSRFEVEEDMVFTSAMPHMHLRGKDYLYQAHYPDGTSEVLLSVPNYDFNWQTRYRFAKPPFLPKGTVLEGVAHFDNSPGNPVNPDPTESVRWGRQTWHEMMFGWANFERVNDR